MKIRIKFAIIIIISAILVGAGTLFYLNYYFTSLLNKQAEDSLKTVAETGKSLFLMFDENIKTRTTDWSSDGYIRNTVEKILDLSTPSKEKSKLIDDLGTYFRDKKMIYDKTVIAMDILNKDGIVIASSDNERIGRNETEHYQSVAEINDWNEVINSKFGQPFSDYLKKEEHEASAHSMSLIFSTHTGIDKNLIPLNAVLMLHFLRTDELTDLIKGKVVSNTASNHIFSETFDSGEIYLADKNGFIITFPSGSKDKYIYSKVSEQITSSCFIDNKEIVKKYINYDGIEVLGATGCIKDEGVILMAEVKYEEVVAPIFEVIRNVTFIVFFIILLGVILAGLLINIILKPLNEISKITKEVSKGNFNSRINIYSNDEFGYLSKALNKALDEIEKLIKNVSGKLNLIENLEQNNIDLENSKKAITNLLEDIDNEKRHVEEIVKVRTKELGEEKSRLISSINSLSFGLIVTDMNGNIILNNSAIYKILNIDSAPKTIFGMSKVFKSFDLLKTYTECVNTQETITIDNVAYLDRFIKIYYAPVVNINKVIDYIILIEDITEAKLLERTRDEFFAVASHELRTPLTAIHGNIDMILDTYVDDIKNKDVKEMLSDVDVASLRLINIVNSFLEVSRLEHGKIVLKIEDFELPYLINKIVKDLSDISKRKNILINYDPSSVSLPKIFSDRARAEQILINLISNAIKYTDKGSVFITTEINNEVITVRIRDTGVGIDIKNQGLLFKKFQQAGSDILVGDYSTGSGLGLYISKMLASSLGGEVGLENSIPGSGSTFYFTLPVKV